MIDNISNILKEQNELMLYTKEATKKYTQKYKEHVILAITSAFGLVIGLAWKDYINKIIDVYIKAHLPQDSLWGEFIAVLVITAIAVAALIFLYRFTDKKEGEKKKA